MTTSLSPELMQVLDGLQQRMRFVHIVKCLTGYPRTAEISAIFGEQTDALENLIMSVLVFIMERTLRYDATCTLADISEFITQTGPGLGIDAGHADFLASYIVITVLQNGGRVQTFTVWDSRSGMPTTTTIRLLGEERGNYHLTDEACEFLFRTKEIDSELDFSVARFKLGELLKRRNYGDALAQSRELVARIRSLHGSMEDFLRRCRENIATVTVDAYESLILRIRKLLENEESELEMIQTAAAEQLRVLNLSLQEVGEDEATAQARESLRQIIGNLTVTISEQRRLINRRADMNELYRHLLEDSFSLRSYQRFQVDDELLLPFRQSDALWDQLSDFASFLFVPLCEPQLQPYFSIENFYAPQQKLTAAKEDELALTPQDDPLQALHARRDERNEAVILGLFTYMAAHDRFTLREYVGTLPMDALLYQCEEDALCQAMLSLYGMQELSVTDWKAADTPVFDPGGEFDLSWCLAKLPEKLLAFDRLRITNPGETFCFELASEREHRRITLTDFHFEVIDP